MEFIPPIEEHAVLQLKEKGIESEPESWQFHPGDWVRVRRGNYKGDLARIRDAHSSGDIVYISVVPRLRPIEEGKRSQPEIFDAVQIKKWYVGETALEYGPNGEQRRFRDQLFVDGLLVLRVSALHIVERCKLAVSELGH